MIFSFIAKKDKIRNDAIIKIYSYKMIFLKCLFYGVYALIDALLMLYRIYKVYALIITPSKNRFCSEKLKGALPSNALRYSPNPHCIL